MVLGFTLKIMLSKLADTQRNMPGLLKKIFIGNFIWWVICMIGQKLLKLTTQTITNGLNGYLSSCLRKVWHIEPNPRSIGALNARQCFLTSKSWVMNASVVVQL